MKLKKFMTLSNQIILEAGVNHLGKISEADKFLNFFLNSDYRYLTFMIQQKTFYEKMKNKLDYNLSQKFYTKAIRLAHKKNKRIGLSVCENITYKPFDAIDFDFYKLLGIAINNKELINRLKLKKKPVYISLAQGSDGNIKKCLKFFGKRKNLNLIYTNRSYNPKHLDLNRIDYLRKKYKLPVGYGHHYQNNLPIYLSTLFKPAFYFFYIKNFSRQNKFIPDNSHAFFTTQLEKIHDYINEAKIILKKKKLSTKINIQSIVDKI